MVTIHGHEVYILTETFHFSVERKERIQLIADNIGFGSEMLSYLGYNSEGIERLYILTDTGVVVVKAIDADVAITAFIPSITQTKAFFDIAQRKMPKWIGKVVVRNGEWMRRNAG